MSEEATGAISGAAKGAATGAAIGSVVPVIGTVVGAVVGGIIGAIGGLMGGKAAHMKKLARREQQHMGEREQAVQRRDMIRQYRLAAGMAQAQASSETGAELSSGVMGSIGSLGSQTLFNTGFFDVQSKAQAKVNKYLKKSDMYGGYAKLADTAMSIFSTASGFLGGGGAAASATPGMAGAMGTMGSGTQSLAGMGVPGG